MNEDTSSLDLKMFVDRLVEEKKYPTNLEQGVIDQIKADLMKRVEERLDMVIINNLPESKLVEFNELMDKNVSEEEMQKFCADNIPNLTQLIASELLVFRQTYVF
jgi:hypothetical protein